MNILHHKSWHVRNKDNIERVRRDEAKAAEEEKEILRRKALAESEARTELLRAKSRKRLRDEDEDTSNNQLVAPPSGHINFFKDEEEGIKKTGTNAEYEAEKLEEKEKQEKALGLLTYLGQSAVEAQNEKPWYFKPPEKRRKLNHEESKSTLLAKEEFDLKHKWSSDPMKTMRTYLSTRDKVLERDKVSQSQPRSHYNIIPEVKGSQSQSRSHYGTVPIQQSTSKGEATASVLSNGASSLSSLTKKHRRKEQKKKKKKKKKKDDKKDRKHKHKKKKKKKSHCSSDSDNDSVKISKHSMAVALPSSSGSKSIQQLRAERLNRERSERAKTEQLLSKLHGAPPKQEEQIPNERETRYNSQFNPDLVRRKKKKTPGDFDPSVL